MSNRAVLSRNPSLKLSLAVILSLVTVWTGCSREASVTAPGTGAPDNPYDATSVSTGGAPKPPPGSESIIVRSEVISAVQGGTILFGSSSLSFSPGALDKDTEIVARDVTSVRGYPCFELSPEGIHFKKPVILQSPIPEGTRPSECRMWWWGQKVSGAWSWVDMGGTVASDGKTISVVLEHFSTYAPGKAGWWKPQGPVDLPLIESDLLQ